MDSKIAKKSTYKLHLEKKIHRLKSHAQFKYHHKVIDHVYTDRKDSN